MKLVFQHYLNLGLNKKAFKLHTVRVQHHNNKPHQLIGYHHVRPPPGWSSAGDTLSLDTCKRNKPRHFQIILWKEGNVRYSGHLAAPVVLQLSSVILNLVKC